MVRTNTQEGDPDASTSNAQFARRSILRGVGSVAVGSLGLTALTSPAGAASGGTTTYSLCELALPGAEPPHCSGFDTQN